MKISILLVETNNILSAGLRNVFAGDERIERIREFSSIEGLQNCQEDYQFPLIIVNQALVSEIAELPRQRFAILASKLDIDFFLCAYESGACGYLFRNSSIHLWRALLDLEEGSFLIDPVSAPEIMQYLLTDTRFAINDGLLTPREREIVQLLREGMNRRLIAEKLCISEATLKTHIKNISKKKRRRT